MTGVVVRISRPHKAVIGHVVPFLARDFTRFAADAHCRVGEKTNLDVLLHVRMPALVRTFCAFANHKVARASGLRGCLGASETHALLFVALILFLPSRGRPEGFRLLWLCRAAVALDGGLLGHP